MADTVDINRVLLLTGADNYQEWSEYMMSHLRAQGIWRIVSGDDRRPPTVYPPLPPSSTPAGSKTGKRKTRVTKTTKDDDDIDGGDDLEAADDEYAEAMRRYERADKWVQEWLDSDDKAHRIICRSLSHSIRHEVMNKESSRAVWETLEKKYDVVSGILSFEGLQSAIRTRCEAFQSVEQYISKMSACLDKLQMSLRASEKLPDSVRIQFLLCNLGEGWDTFLTCYLNSCYDRQSTTYSEVTQILIQWEMRAKFHAASANLVKSDRKMDSGDRSKRNGSGKKKRKCKVCRKAGHSKKDCWTAHPSPF
ncbi:hypothetical protein BDV18DRAFT_36367 [Aspergillus unguis]